MRQLAVFLIASAFCGGISVATASAARESALFDQFVGTWDVVYDVIDKSGSLRRSRGQVTYRSILGGLATQEVWTDTVGAKQLPYGTTIDYYDGKHRRWTQVWIYPAQGMTMSVTGSEVGRTIVLTGRDETGALQRWSIGDIEPDSYVSRFESSSDNGKTWRLFGINHVSRHKSSS
jgi:hypothetical protein